MNFSHWRSAFGIFINGCENRGELACFVEQAGHPGWLDTTAFFEQFKRIPGFKSCGFSFMAL